MSGLHEKVKVNFPDDQKVNNPDVLQKLNEMDIKLQATNDRLNQTLDMKPVGSEIQYNKSIRQVSPLQLLNTPTYDGTGEATHPSVLYIGAGISPDGYKWWMAMTPYANMDTSLENPSILASYDGINWVEPSTGMNPIEGPPTNGYYADTTLFYNEREKKFYLFFYQPSATTTYLITSTDGINWTAKTTTNLGSVTAIALNDGTFIGFSNGGIKYSSTDGITWKESGNFNVNFPTGTQGHMTVFLEAGGYHFLQSIYPNNVTQRHQLIYGYSRDGTYVEWDMNSLLYPEITGWTRTRVYTSCMTLSEDQKLRVYVSAVGDQGSRIGLMEVVTNQTPTLNVKEADPYIEYKRLAESVVIPVGGNHSLGFLNTGIYKDYIFYVSCTQKYRVIGYSSPDGNTISPSTTFLDNLGSTAEKRPVPVSMPTEYKFAHSMLPKFDNLGTADAILDVWLLVKR